MSQKNEGFSTRCVHGGENLCPLTGSITTPIYQTSNFGFSDLDSLKDTLADPSKGYFYSRLSNPTFEAVEEKLAGLMGAQRAVVFSSGLAAITSTILSLISSGEGTNSVSSSSAICSLLSFPFKNDLPVVNDPKNPVVWNRCLIKYHERSLQVENLITGDYLRIVWSASVNIPYLSIG